MNQETIVVGAITIGVLAFVWIETGLALKLIGMGLALCAPFAFWTMAGDALGQTLIGGGSLIGGLALAGIGTLILDRRKEIAARRLAPVEEPVRRAG